jgi:conjugative relaxase-like TrwC/TraI family protein
MSLWKLRVGAEAYYLDQVASGLDDYYSGQGETVGRWVGNAVSGLGLEGDVTGEDLRAVLAGLKPGTGLTPNGEQLRAHPRRVPGFDLTFSVPKSVSVAYALGDPLVQGAVIEASEHAVAQAVAWLEREACHVRRGTNRQQAKLDHPAEWGTRRLPGAGFVAAQFRHRTSRAGDPQLHWHVLVANTTVGPDLRWSALDASGLYRSQRAAGVIFQAALRQELTRRLGVEWGPAVKDSREIAGIPRRILRVFSKRRSEIETELERLGQSGPRSAQQATLATRQAKTLIDTESLLETWQHEATTAGWGPEQLDDLLGRTPQTDLRPVTPDGLVRRLGDRLIDSDATFTRHDVAQAIAGTLAGATTPTIDQLTAGVLAHPELVAIQPLGIAGAAGWEERYTTRRLIGLETGIRTTIAAGIGSDTGRLQPGRVAIACASASLGADQHDAVTRLCGQGNAIEVLVGRAGTGKTYTLNTIATAYRQNGWNVIGVAPSARAARELHNGANITSFTIPRFHNQLARTPLTANTVVMVDEAGMCGTVDLHKLITVVRAAGAKMILVGDNHQLPEIQAGGGLTHAITALGNKTCELTVNRRQTEPWEQDALAQLRHGNITSAWNAYTEHGRVIVADHPIALHRAVINDWWQAHQTGADTLLLAGTRAEANALNRLARQHAADHGTLTGPELTTAGRVFQQGDRVLITQNRGDQPTVTGGRTRIDNGMLGTITSINIDNGTVDVRLPHATVRLDRAYLDAGHLDHGYAMTIHKSQGTTCDHVYVVGPAGLYREAAYVALSRARHGATLYATTKQGQEVGERDHTRGLPLPGETTLPEHALLSTIQRTHAKTFATTDDPNAEQIANLATLPLDELDTRLAAAATAETSAKQAGLADPAEQQAALLRAEHARAHIAVGRRVRALDRNNVGTVTSIHDATGHATVLFVANDNTQAETQLPWHNLKPIDHPSLVEITAAARDWLSNTQAGLDATASLWTAHLTTHGIKPGDATLIDRAINTREDMLGKQLHAESPDWLVWWIGNRPNDAIGATTWDDTTRHIATWRDRHHTPTDQPGHGLMPDDPTERDHWVQAMTTTLKQRAWLTQRNPQPPEAAVMKLSAVEIHARLEELERIFATAPTEQTNVVDDIVRGNLSEGELHDTLAQAAESPSQRDRWIIANWPHIVEHQQLQQLAAEHNALAHWPIALRPAARRVLQQLLANSEHVEPDETRTIAELESALLALDPAAHLHALTQELADINDRISAIADGSAPAGTNDHNQLIQAERDVLGAKRSTLRSAIRDERRKMAEQRWDGGPANRLHAAIAQRTTTLYQQAIDDPPQWAVQLLNDLDDNGSLQQLPNHRVAQLLQAEALERDRGLGGSHDNQERSVSRSSRH